MRVKAGSTVIELPFNLQHMDLERVIMYFATLASGLGPYGVKVYCHSGRPRWVIMSR